MTVRYTKQGCRVETTYIIQPNGGLGEHVELSVDPAHALSLAVEDPAGKTIEERSKVAKMQPRFRR